MNIKEAFEILENNECPHHRRIECEECEEEECKAIKCVLETLWYGDEIEMLDFGKIWKATKPTGGKEKC